jgi:hypothetical protein
MDVIPMVTGIVSWAVLFRELAERFIPDPVTVPRFPAPSVLGRGQRWTVALLALWAAYQVGVPLRHFFIPGEVSWTEEGHRFAWHMKLRDKDGEARFFARDPANGETWEINTRRLLRSWQYSKMSTRPYMIHQYVQHLKRRLAVLGRPGIEIRVVAPVSLNGRPPQLMVDPEVDLTQARVGLAPSTWILPLESPAFAAPPGTHRRPVPTEDD